MDIEIITLMQWAVLLTGIGDSYKYKFITQKVSRYKSSKEQSRKLINFTIGKNFILLAYGYFFLNDWCIIGSAIAAIFFASEAFYYCYYYYPYKNKKKKGWKRPSLLTYTIHSLTPNKYAKKL